MDFTGGFRIFYESRRSSDTLISDKENDSTEKYIWSENQSHSSVRHPSDSVLVIMTQRTALQMMEGRGGNTVEELPSKITLFSCIK